VGFPKSCGQRHFLRTKQDKTEDADLFLLLQRKMVMQNLLISSKLESRHTKVRIAAFAWLAMMKHTAGSLGVLAKSRTANGSALGVTKRKKPLNHVWLGTHQCLCHPGGPTNPIKLSATVSMPASSRNEAASPPLVSQTMPRNTVPKSVM